MRENDDNIKISTSSVYNLIGKVNDSILIIDDLAESYLQMIKKAQGFWTGNGAEEFLERAINNRNTLIGITTQLKDLTNRLNEINNSYNGVENLNKNTNGLPDDIIK
ncbi:MAG: hypothetical protein ACI4RN_06925 [Oscillospiraceae bacterium]